MADLTATVETSAEKLEKAVEAAGYVHPEAPEGFATPGHKLAAEQGVDPVDHLKEIAALAQAARTASPAGIETISDQILAHVAALSQ
jgi:hypothetical protein